MPKTFVIVWRYLVPEDHRAPFEAAYGSDGVWARLFAQSPHYLGTELLGGGPGEYVTIDRWDAEAEASSFIAAHRTEYDRIDRACADLTEAEVLLFRGSRIG